MNKRLFFVACLWLLAVCAAHAQRTRKTAPQPAPTPEQIFFAVAGEAEKTLEPIAVWRAGKLETTVGGDADDKTLNAFAKTYYRAGQKYNLVFGGGAAGTASVVKSLTATDCAKSNATAKLQSKAQLNNKLVMALATNANAKLPAPVRRRPTPAEREAVSLPVRAEFTKQKVSATALKGLNYVNLTVLDLDRDGALEMVGSALVAGKGVDRRLLFFIAGQRDGKYELQFSNYEQITADSIMSGGDVKDVDTGLLNELLVDVYDLDGDGVAEVFTVVQSFESNTYAVYHRAGGAWGEWFRGSNYHCAF
jgi:hypothetical protein